MNKKKLLISITTIICLALLITACYFVFYRSFDIVDTYIRLEPIRNAEQFNATKDYINRNTNNGSYQIFYDTNNFPSESYEDYCHILVHYTVKNYSPFNISVNDGYITDMTTADYVMFKRPIAFETNLGAFELKVSEDCYDFLCYRGDLSDEELIEKFKDLQINILYENLFFNSLTYKCDLSNSIFVSSFDEFDEIRNQIMSNK